jgi:hypothetical protein
MEEWAAFDKANRKWEQKSSDDYAIALEKFEAEYDTQYEAKNPRPKPPPFQPSGQALVESALIFSIIVFLLIGVLELGWVLRAYLILTNASREAARFAVRQNYLDFRSSNPNYQSVWTHTLESISSQIDYNEATGAMIISYIEAESACTLPFTITTPLEVPTFTWTFPATAAVQTQLNYALMGAELGRLQQKHSCDVIAAGNVPRPNNTITVELWFSQRQLLGFPGISNLWTDPVILYSRASFRKIQETRND